ncbi:beta-ketoacyl-[acyl-carrier-protein] synthase family protein [Candidatus Poribacteria bacterium]|nr:beta-ketoacyl-[acyl-carrier-protein] synthase family protein [Candidatus Poribacteria bacterium]
MTERVVITGIGVITPLGIGKAEFWENLLAGQSGIGPVQSFDTSAYAVHLGAEVKGFDPRPYVQTLNVEQLGRCSQLAIAATRLALRDAGLDLGEMCSERAGIALGTTMGEPQVLEEMDKQWVEAGPEQIHSELIPRYPCNVIPSNIAVEFGFRGPNIMIPTACAAGNYAIGYAADLLKQNRADVMIAGGADCFSRIAFTGFARLAAIAPEICQPFDKNRKGMIVGEGAGILILESLHRAMQRNAPIYAEVLGCGLSCDAYHMTGSHPEGLGMVKAMNKALRQSGVVPQEVSYISAHGTGTLTNDRVETIAIKKVFGEHAYKVPISSIKSMIGHTMGAASAIEAAVCALSIPNGVIPPTINYEEKDPEGDLDYVPNKARAHPVNIALNNSAAFGGNNAVLILGKVF